MTLIRNLPRTVTAYLKFPILKKKLILKFLTSALSNELLDLMGFLNHCHWNGYVKVLCGIKEALKFPQKLNVVYKDYLGNVFE